MKTFLLLLLTASLGWADVTLSNVWFNGSYVENVNATNAAPSDNTTTNGAVAFWSMDAAGGNTNDSSPNGIDLVSTGGFITNYPSGKIAEAISFNASGTRDLYAPDNDGFSAVDNSITVAFWVQLFATNETKYLLSKGDLTAGTKEWTVGYDKTAHAWFTFFYTNSAASVARAYAVTNELDLSTWYFVSMQIDTTNQVSKIRWGKEDGTLYPWNQSAVFGWSKTNTTGALTFGRLATSGYAAAAYDEAGVWNRLLTDVEITNVFNSGTGKTWPFD